MRLHLALWLNQDPREQALGMTSVAVVVAVMVAVVMVVVVVRGEKLYRMTFVMKPEVPR